MGKWYTKEERQETLKLAEEIRPAAAARRLGINMEILQEALVFCQAPETVSPSGSTASTGKPPDHPAQTLPQQHRQS